MWYEHKEVTKKYEIEKNSDLNNVSNNVNDMRFNGSLPVNIQKDNIDMDSIVLNGFYTIVNPTNNSPFTSGAFGLIVVGNNGSVNVYCTQIACSFTTYGIKIRTKAGNSSWTAWKTLSMS